MGRGYWLDTWVRFFVESPDFLGLEANNFQHRRCPRSLHGFNGVPDLLLSGGRIASLCQIANADQHGH